MPITHHQLRRRRRRRRAVRPDHRRSRWPGPAYASWSSRSIPACRSFPRPPACAPGPMEILRSWGLEDDGAQPVAAGPAGHGDPADAVAPRDEVVHGPARPTTSSAASARRGSPCSRRTGSRRSCWQHLLDHGGEVRFAHRAAATCGSDDDGVHGHGPGRGTDRSKRPRSARLPGRRRRRAQHGPRPAGHRASSSSARRATTWRPCSAPTCRPVMPAVPFVLTATVAPGVEGMFVTTGRAEPLDLRHRVASRGR